MSNTVALNWATSSPFCKKHAVEISKPMPTLQCGKPLFWAARVGSAGHSRVPHKRVQDNSACGKGGHHACTLCSFRLNINFKGLSCRQEFSQMQKSYTAETPSAVCIVCRLGQHMQPRFTDFTMDLKSCSV